MTLRSSLTAGLRLGLPALALALAPAAAGADDFDGKKTLICAPVEVADCVAGFPCYTDTPAEMGAPEFFRVDFGRKSVIGPRAEAAIKAVSVTDDQLQLQGIELGHVFSIAIDRQSGRMTGTLNDARGAFVLFGSCIAP